VLLNAIILLFYRSVHIDTFTQVCLVLCVYVCIYYVAVAFLLMMAKSNKKFRTVDLINKNK